MCWFVFRLDRRIVFAYFDQLIYFTWNTFIIIEFHLYTVLFDGQLVYSLIQAADFVVLFNKKRSWLIFNRLESLDWNDNLNL
jgi:hypothetical protein